MKTAVSFSGMNGSAPQQNLTVVGEVSFMMRHGKRHVKSAATCAGLRNCEY